MNASDSFHTSTYDPWNHKAYTCSSKASCLIEEGSNLDSVRYLVWGWLSERSQSAVPGASFSKVLSKLWPFRVVQLGFRDELPSSALPLLQRGDGRYRSMIVPRRKRYSDQYYGSYNSACKGRLGGAEAF